MELPETQSPAAHKECLQSLLAVRDALDAINGKWKLQIIIALSSGYKKFTDIERQIPRITARMLSKELKDLEMHQLVKRTVYDTVPVTIEYHLTPHAQTLDPLIMELRNWGMLHRNKVISNRE
jgi:DNA-binding HxlR family transcriptional regulator